MSRLRVTRNTSRHGQCIVIPYHPLRATVTRLSCCRYAIASLLHNTMRYPFGWTYKRASHPRSELHHHHTYIQNSSLMIQFPFLGGTVGFDVALRPGIVEFTIEIKFKYFENQFIAKVPVGREGRHIVEHMV